MVLRRTKSPSSYDLGSDDTEEGSAERLAPTPRRTRSNNTGLFKMLGTFVGKTVGKDLAALTVRVAELEARPAGLNYCGVWQSGRSYAKNDGVTAGGSIWVARKDFPTGAPGQGKTDWQLSVKSGRRGKDAT